MKFLLDTNTLSEIRKGVKGQDSVYRWSRDTSGEDLALSAVTLMELERGERSIRRRDPAQADLIRRWLDRIVRPTFVDRILPVDEVVAVRCAPLHVPDKRPVADSLIAATALVHDLTVVTRNVRDFEPMGVKLLDPWNA